LIPRYRKNADLLDMDYIGRLPPDALAFHEAFTASYYLGAPSEEPGSVPPDEAHALNAQRRRDIYTAMERVSLPVDQVVDFPPYRSPMGEARKRMARRRWRKKEAA